MCRVWKFIGVCLGVIVLGVGIGLASLDHIAKNMLIGHSTKLLKVPVEVGEVDIDLRRGEINIKRFVVHNPRGYERQHFLEVDTTRINLELSSLFRSTIKVHEVAMHSLKLDLELRLDGDNYSHLMRNIRENGDVKKVQHHDGHAHHAVTVAQTAEAKTVPASGRHVVVEQLDITNLEVHTKSAGLLETDSTIPALRFEGLQSDGAKQIIHTLLSQVRPNLTKLDIEPRVDVERTIKNVKEGIKHLFK